MFKMNYPKTKTKEKLKKPSLTKDCKQSDKEHGDPWTREEESKNVFRPIYCQK